MIKLIFLLLSGLILFFGIYNGDGLTLDYIYFVINLSIAVIDYFEGKVRG